MNFFGEQHVIFQGVFYWICRQTAAVHQLSSLERAAFRGLGPDTESFGGTELWAVLQPPWPMAWTLPKLSKHWSELQARPSIRKKGPPPGVDWIVAESRQIVDWGANRFLHRPWYSATTLHRTFSWLAGRMYRLMLPCEHAAKSHRSSRGGIGPFQILLRCYLYMIYVHIYWFVKLFVSSSSLLFEKWEVLLTTLYIYI